MYARAHGVGGELGRLSRRRPSLLLPRAPAVFPVPLIAHTPRLSQVNDEPTATTFDFTFEEQGVTETDLRKLIWQQLQKFHPELGAMP